MLVKTDFAAGELKQFTEEANFFRIMEASGILSVIFYMDGKEVARAENIKTGYSEKFLTTRFNRVVITNNLATTQSIQFVMRLGNEVMYDTPPVGDVNIKNANGTFIQGQASVATTSTGLQPANSLRRYLMIQNNGGTDIYVTLDGSAATVGNGIRIVSGGSLELQGFVPTGAINAIASGAANPSVLVVVGA